MLVITRGYLPASSNMALTKNHQKSPMVRWFSRTKPPWLVGSFTAASHLGWHPMILLLHNISSLGQPALSHNGFPKFPKQLSNSYSTWISRTFINIQVSVRADYQWQSENENWVILIDATRGHNPNPWWHQNSPKSRGSSVKSHELWQVEIPIWSANKLLWSILAVPKSSSTLKIGY